eukprot:TRINITY_DN34680_c0_g1_i1.p1 TRINITY_DN34680_c0_g1~~TRINITY_DN34680_c0_g1_i1.p1  ORF type:complete len:615 (+),score=127.05 TRINITY_DN34680_c0_g1_i1:76-1920(+)
MAVLDRCLRPSSTTYDFCASRNQLHPWTSEVENAKDDDEALIATINREVDIASSKLLGGEARAAISVLRRAYRIAKGSAPATGIGAAVSGKEVTPAWRLGLATVHLHLCIVLSKLGRHQQAIEEARAGCIAMDEVWRTILTASAETDAAEIDGDFSKPAAPLKKLLARPPAWLEQAVEVAIQTRQALAAEAEMLAVPGAILQFHQRGMARRVMSDTSLSESSQQLDASVPAMSSSSSAASLRTGAGSGDKGWFQDVRRLHREAVMLATSLLPEEHEARICAERACREAEARATARSIPADSPEANGFSTNLPPLLQLQARSRLPVRTLPGEMNESNSPASPATAPKRKQRGGSVAAATSKSCSALEDSSRKGATGTSLKANTGLSYLTCPRGDVFAASLPERSRETSRIKRSPESSPKAKEHAQAPVAPRSPTGEKIDPFKDWKLNVLTDTNQMNLRQMMLRTEEGQVKLQAELKRDCHYFKSVLLKEYDDDKLFDSRVRFSDYGMQVGINSEKKKEKFRELMYAPTEKAIQRKAWEKDLFALYGVPYSEKKGPDVKALKKLFIASYDRTPHAKAERQREEEDRRRREAQEKADKFSGLQLGKQADVAPVAEPH